MTARTHRRPGARVELAREGGTWDGRWLSFTRRDGPWRTATTGDVFWIDARVLERFR